MARRSGSPNRATKRIRKNDEEERKWLRLLGTYPFCNTSFSLCFNKVGKVTTKFKPIEEIAKRFYFVFLTRSVTVNSKSL